MSGPQYSYSLLQPSGALWSASFGGHALPPAAGPETGATTGDHHCFYLCQPALARRCFQRLGVSQRRVLSCAVKALGRPDLSAG